MPTLRRATDRVPRYGLLLACILLELMFAPLFATSALGVQMGRVLGGGILVVALCIGGIGRVGMALFALAVVLQLGAVLVGLPALGPVVSLSRLPFVCYILGLIVWRVLRDRDVTWDTIAGAACAYVVLGFVWGDVYQLVDYWRPGSFEIPDSFRLGPARDPKAALMYFSFVTLTTVGYGVIHPNDPGIGGLCVAEAICGQLYLAIMISRMVGLHLATNTQ